MDIDIKIDGTQLNAALERLKHVGGDLTPAMRKISQTLATETELNFLAEGRPKWVPLSETTKLLRQGKKKKTGGQFRILQHRGQLAASVDTQYDATSASTGSNKVYSAIQQRGGKAGRGLKVTIPARPYLPVTASDELQPAAEQGVLETIMRHIGNAAGV